jgi:pimeloyl-ACP methyl ester carboxylesterase
MIPPHHNRSNWPPEFRSKLVAAGISVLAFDRRGAGNSEGEAKDAYLGPKTALDLQAALDWLGSAADPRPDNSRWVALGASNGTTTCLDWLVANASRPAALLPRALVFMTGGPYTEAQNKLRGSPAESVPLLFTFDGKESGWSLAQREGKPPPRWQWQQYDPGGHGTRVFRSNPESMDAVASFVQSQLALP